MPSPHNQRPLVYVAGPYTCPDPDANVARAIETAEALEASGEVSALVPHLSHLWETHAHHEPEFWYDYDLALLARCDAMLLLPGASRGTSIERRYAEERGIPVLRSVEATIAWAKARSQARAHARRRRLVALGHRAGTGKDTLAQILVERHGFTRVAFADPLKRLAAELAPHLAQPFATALQEHGPDALKSLRGGRDLLITLGNGVRRHIAPDAWIQPVLTAVHSSDHDLVVPDLRFPNEAAALRGAGFRLVRVDRPGVGPGSGGESDEALANYHDWDQVVCNDGTLEDLERTADALLEKLLDDHGAA